MSRVTEFDDFYDRESPGVLKFLYAVTGDRAVARDATIDAFRRAWRDWDRYRGSEALRHVRVEGWKAQAVERGTHPLRRRHEEDSDVELLDALADLRANERRLVVLMTLGRTDLDVAAREIGVSDEEAIEQVTTAITGLEKATGQSISELEQRLNALGDVTGGIALPDAAEIRTQATRGRRFTTIGLVAATILAILAGSIALTDGRPLSRLISDPYREQLGAESHDLILDAQKIDTETLLTTGQVDDLAPTTEWKQASTETDPEATGALTTCPTKRFATEDPLKVFARSFVSQSGTSQRVVQSLEVARTVDAARAAHDEALQWFAGCEVPLMQLTESYRVQRPYGDVLILRLVQNGSAPRTLTVGLSTSGTVSTTVVHEVDGLEDVPTIEDFAHTVNTSLQKVCSDSGGECSDAVEPVPVDPPALAEHPAFLAPIDLPAIAGVESPWTSTEPSDGAVNPAASTCDPNDFAASGATASSQVFVLTEAPGLAASFGMVETVATFGTTDAATAFVNQVQTSVNGCSQVNLAATISESVAIGETPDYRAASWAITLQVENGEPVMLRSAIVQRGNAVARVLFTPSGTTTLTSEQFAVVVNRALQRLAYAGS